MVELEELKEWLHIDGEDEDNTLSSLISSSRMIIKQATGITKEDVDNNKDAIELYKLIQKLIITGFYENRGDSTSTENKGLTSLYIQLESYKYKQRF